MSVEIFLKRSGTPDKRPVGSSLQFGELCINYDPVSGGIFYKESTGNIIKVGPCQVSADAPNSNPAGSSGNSVGEFWYDTSIGTLKIFNGASWVSSGGGVAVTGVSPIVVNSVDPINPIVSVLSASTTQPGVVQLNNTTISNSTTEALTASVGKNLQDQITALSVSQNTTLAGTLDGSTGTMLTVTTEGAGVGFTVGGPLPAPAASNKEYFAIVAVPGTMTPPGGSSTGVSQGDWWLSDGSVWSFLDLGYNVNYATALAPGVVELATNAETQAGTDSTRSVTPSSLQSKISDDTATTSSTTIASSTAVKSAFDAAAAAQSTADTNASSIGTLTNLQTQEKSNLVGAINEHETRIDLLGNSLIYGGTYDASTNLVASVTQAGVDAGLVVGSALPTGAVTSNVFVIVSVQGTGTAPAPSILLEVGNWLVSNGTTWDYLQLGNPVTTADLVTNTPSGSISSTNVQNALNELDLEKTPKTTQVIAGNGLSGGGALSADVTLSLPATGVTIGSYGSDGQIPQVEVDTYGRITNITEISASLGGLSDVNLVTDPPSGQDVLQYNGTATEWQPKTLREASITSLSDLNAVQGNFAHVDAATGNDVTAIFGDVSRPYATIKAALVAASANAPSIVLVSEGTYNEVNPLIVPAGVQIVGRCGTLGWVHTNITPTVPTDDLIVMTGDGAGVTGVTVTVPISSGKGAIVYEGPNGTTGSVTFTGIRGQSGSLGVGIYCRCASSGKIISFENRYRGGDMDSLLRIDGGILANESTHVPNTPVGGGPRVVFLQQNSLGAPISRLQSAAANSGNSNVQHVFETSGGTAVFFGVNWFNAANGIHITSNDYDVEINGGLIQCTSALLVDNGLTGANGRLFASAQMTENFIYPFTWSDSEYTLEFNTKATDPAAKSSSKVLHGADLVIGELHKGSGASIGRGGPYKGDMKVLTSDSTASATTDGGNITNVTAEAFSKTGSTFTFQGVNANHCIYFGTTEDDSTGTPLKHTGLDISVITGDLVGKYVVEIWNGSSWAEVGVQAVSNTEGYSYANNLFWRNNSDEDIFYGIRPATVWAVKSIGGFSCYWSRVRIVTPPTAVPQFETVWLLPISNLTVSSEGVVSKMGFGQYGVVNTQGSNIFTEQGTLVDYAFTMGPGGGTSYIHTIANIQIGSAGEGLFWQTAIVPGICTALPFYVDIGYSLGNTPSTTAPVFNLYLTPIETSGTLIADPTGGLVPIPRPESLTTSFTGAGSRLPDIDTISWPFVQQDKLHRARFGPFNISDYYEGDALAIFLECVSNGTPTSVTNVWGVALIGYQWTDGIRGY